LPLHGKITARSLETLKSPQAGRQDIQASHASAEIGGESARPPRRPPLSKPRGQHAHGSAEDLQEEGLEGVEIVEGQVGKDICEEDRQAQSKEEGKVLTQGQRIRARLGFPRR
jgi:hypothetical protein